MVNFNFFECDEENLLNCFCEYFDLDIISTKIFFDKANREKIIAEDVIKNLSINLDQFDSKFVSIVGRHMTTTNNQGLDSFYEFGILDLKQMLKRNNDLTDTMREFDLRVDYDNKTIKIGEKLFSLDIGLGNCVVCLKDNEEVCTWYSGCELKQNLKLLSLKLYHYDATIEFFISGNIDSMKSYSTIDRYPEILHTLDEIRSAMRIRAFNYEMAQYWVKMHPLCITIEFNAFLSDMESFNPICKDSWYDSYGAILDSCGYNEDDYYCNRIPKRVFDNLHLIKWFLSFYYWGPSESYGSLLPDLHVKSNQITQITYVK